MDELDEQQAAESLATIREHQDRARRAARQPWWVYAAMFVLTAALTAANDFVDLSGTKLIAALVLVLLLVTVVITFVGRSAPLSRVRGVQPRQSFVPSAFAVVLVVGGFGGWLISRYGTGFTTGVAGAVGLRAYPNTVAGVLYGAAFTALFALGQLMVEASHRRTGR